MTLPLLTFCMKQCVLAPAPAAGVLSYGRNTQGLSTTLFFPQLQRLHKQTVALIVTANLSCWARLCWNWGQFIHSRRSYVWQWRAFLGGSRESVGGPQESLATAWTDQTETAHVLELWLYNIDISTVKVQLKIQNKHNMAPLKTNLFLLPRPSAGQKGVFQWIVQSCTDSSSTSSEGYRTCRSLHFDTGAALVKK